MIERNRFESNTICIRYKTTIYILSRMNILDIETLPTAGEAKMAKPLIFLATIGATFNRHLVDIARVVSSSLPQISRFRRYGVYKRVQACLKFSTFSSQRPSSPIIPIRSRRFALESKTGQAAPGSGRRFKQSSKGKRARRKKSDYCTGVVPPLDRFVP